MTSKYLSPDLYSDLPDLRSSTLSTESSKCPDFHISYVQRMFQLALSPSPLYLEVVGMFRHESSGTVVISTVLIRFPKTYKVVCLYSIVIV